MRWYLAQDYKFIDEFVRLLATAITHAPTLADGSPKLDDFWMHIKGAVNLMRTRIRFLAKPKPKPKSMRSVVDATQREQQHGSA